MRHMERQWNIVMPRLLLDRYGMARLHQVLIDLEQELETGKLPSLRNPAGFLLWCLARAAGEGAARSKSADQSPDELSQRRFY